MRIFVIGFMGSGKTYWGKLWAQQNSLAFFDLDEEVINRENKTIKSIFEEHGEVYFRNKESDVLKSLDKSDNCIIACGGGTACFNNNMEWMNSRGVTVYLSIDPLTIYSRLKAKKEKRPLIKDLPDSELLPYIRKKLKEREPFYNQAKIIMTVKQLNVDTIKQIINYPL